MELTNWYQYEELGPFCSRQALLEGPCEFGTETPGSMELVTLLANIGETSYMEI